MKIGVIGLGYIGLANAVMLSRVCHICACDTDRERLRLIASGRSPIRDADIQSALDTGGLDMELTDSADIAAVGADFVIVAVPTDSAGDGCGFDTTVVERVAARAAAAAPGAVIVLRSTLPVGFTEKLCKALPDVKLLFVPEFSREGKSLYDSLHPSRIIIGTPSGGPDCSEAARVFAGLLCAYAGNDTPLMYMGSSEAEAVKLFSNTFLAVRVSFFNELDSFACVNGLDSGSIIDGMAPDPRIGGYYNNPSFGYGGNCLPKDVNQLLADFDGAPGTLIRSVDESNRRRKAFMSAELMKQLPPGGTLGIYRLIMKTGSDNYRRSAVLDVAKEAERAGARVLVYEPTFGGAEFDGFPVTDDLAFFKSQCSVIAANRFSGELADVKSKVYTRDKFHRD